MKTIMGTSWRAGLLWLVFVAGATTTPAIVVIADGSSKVVIVEAWWYMNSPEPAYHHNFALSAVSEQTWGYHLRYEGVDCYSQDLSNTSFRLGEQRKFVYQVKVRNVGEGKIIAIDWSYVFTDAETEGTMTWHSFRGRENILPHRVKVLTEVSSAPPARVVNVRTLRRNPEHPFAETVVINSVSFSDGSEWVRSGPK